MWPFLAQDSTDQGHPSLLGHEPSMNIHHGGSGSVIPWEGLEVKGRGGPAASGGAEKALESGET